MTAPQSNRHGKSILLAIALLTSLLLTPTGLCAQDKTRNLSGSVTDRDHEPLRGAVVQLENEGTQAVISYITDQRGRYEFKRLGADTDYRVWATYRGVRSKEHSLDKFGTKHNPRIDLVIKLP